MGIVKKGPSRSSGGGSAGGNSGWEAAPTERQRKVVFMDIYGDTNTGRTTFALTAPGPIGVAHTAEKVDGIIEPFAKKKEVRWINFGGSFVGNPQEVATKAALRWDKMSSAWKAAIGDWARTLIMDTAYEGWEMIRLARFGELKPKGRIDNLYGPVNAEWRGLFKPFKDQNYTNIITIHQAKEEYVDKLNKANGQVTSHRTGRLVHAGMKEMRYMADVVIRMERRPDYTVVAIIEKGWFNPDVIGLELEGDQATFPVVMSMITGEDESEWS